MFWVNKTQELLANSSTLGYDNYSNHCREYATVEFLQLVAVL